MIRWEKYKSTMELRLFMIMFDSNFHLRWWYQKRRRIVRCDCIWNDKNNSKPLMVLMEMLVRRSLNKICALEFWSNKLVWNDRSYRNRLLIQIRLKLLVKLISEKIDREFRNTWHNIEKYQRLTKCFCNDQTRHNQV